MASTDKPIGRAVLLIVISAVSFGSISVLTVLITSERVPLITAMTWRYVLAGVILGGVSVTDRPLQVATQVAHDYEARTGLSIVPRDVLDSPYSLIGSVPELVEKLGAMRERWGINSILAGWLDEPEIRTIAPVVEQLAEA